MINGKIISRKIQKEFPFRKITRCFLFYINVNELRTKDNFRHTGHTELYIMIEDERN